MSVSSVPGAPGRPNILFFGKSDRRIEAWARAHARVVAADGARVVFIAPYGSNYTQDNFTFVNCYTVSGGKALAEIQRELPVSINRALACDRSLTDYTWSTPYYRYGRGTPAAVERLVEQMAIAIWQYMDTAQYCIDGLFDNFITPLASYIARARGVPFYSVRLWQYWHDRFHIVDRPGYICADVNRCYPRYYRRVGPQMCERIIDEFAAARFSPGAFAAENLRLRLQIIRDKFTSYERLSLRHLVRRRLARIAGGWQARGLRFTDRAHRPAAYLVFALHVAPEASILGTDPDLADQFSLIRRMSINVPFGVQILCKAHPGDRFGRDLDIGFLRRLCSMHNVSLVPESENIGSFLEDERCLAIATINGSVAFDAVLGRKPCFVFGKGIFAIADCFLKPQSDAEFFQQVSTIMEGRYRLDSAALAAIILSLKRAAVPSGRSFRSPGTWLDYYTALLPSIHAHHRRQLRRTALHDPI